jgi:hypothetical protein
MSSNSVDWSAILTGIFSSLAASLIFASLLFRVRPGIRISPCIAMDLDPSNNQTVFVFKVINSSPFFKIYELRCSVAVYDRIPSHNGEDLKRINDVPLINNSHWVLEKFNWRHLSQNFTPEIKLTTRTDYAIQFGTTFEIDKVIQSRKIIVFEVFAKHALSGFRRLKKKNTAIPVRLKRALFVVAIVSKSSYKGQKLLNLFPIFELRSFQI